MSTTKHSRPGSRSSADRPATWSTRPIRYGWNYQTASPAVLRARGQHPCPPRGEKPGLAIVDMFRAFGLWRTFKGGREPNSGSTHRLKRPGITRSEALKHRGLARTFPHPAPRMCLRCHVSSPSVDAVEPWTTLPNRQTLKLGQLSACHWVRQTAR